MHLTIANAHRGVALGGGWSDALLS